MRSAVLALCFGLAACASEGGSSAGSTDDLRTGYRVELTTPPSVTAGATVELGIRVVAANDAPVTKFDDLHTEPMHVIAVSSDLTDFAHVHPALAADGSLSVDVPIALAEPYQLFFEYDPAGPAGEQTNRAPLLPTGATKVAPKLASADIFDGRKLRTAITGSTRVDLEPVAGHMIMPGMAAPLRVSIMTSAGAPATDLVDWLGMPGHAIVLSEDESTFIHAHAMHPGSGGMGGMGGMGHGGGASSTPAAPNELEIDLTLPKAGLYKMFLQVKRGNDVVTAPFVLEAMAM